MGPDAPHRFRFDYGFENDLGHGDKAGIGTVTANGYIDLPMGLPVTPYVGAGVGWGFVNLDSGHDQDGVAAALTGGVTFDVSQSVAVDVGYRFRPCQGRFSPMTIINDHAVTGGPRFKF